MAELSRDQGRVIEAARISMATTIQTMCDGDHKLALHLAMVCAAGMFADIITSSSAAGASDLVAVTNQQIEPAGWRLVPVARN